MDVPADGNESSRISLKRVRGSPCLPRVPNIPSPEREGCFSDTGNVNSGHGGAFVQPESC
jgi:hypothetical protein